MSEDKKQPTVTGPKRLEMRRIDELIPYANNARTHSEEQIEKIRVSLREFKFVNPVLIDDANNIIAGHGRVEAAKREGVKEVPCVLVEHLTEAQKRAYILADNRLAEEASGAGWDTEILKEELDFLTGIDFDITITGFDLFDFTLKDVSEDEFDVNATIESIKEPVTKSGDIWRLGRHRLMCGDSTNPEDMNVLTGGVLPECALLTRRGMWLLGLIAIQGIDSVKG